MLLFDIMPEFIGLARGTLLHGNEHVGVNRSVPSPVPQGDLSFRK